MMMRVKGLLRSIFRSSKCKGFLIWLVVCLTFFMALDRYFGSSVVSHDPVQSPNLDPNKDPDDIKLRAADLDSLFDKSSPNHHPRLSNPHRLQDHLQICSHPKLDLEHDANKDAFFKMDPLWCMGSSLFSIKNGELAINHGVLGTRSLSQCKYAGIERVNDGFSTFTSELNRKHGPFEIRVKHDFIHIECSLGVTEEPGRQLQSVKSKRTIKSVNNSSLTEEPGRQLHGVKSKRTIKPVNNSSLLKRTDLSRRLTDYHDGGEENVVNVADFVDNTEDDIKYSEHAEESRFDYGEMYLGIDEPDFEQFLAHVVPSTEAFQRIEELHKEGKRFHPDRMNVLILCLDSMSHLSYQRKLPLTYKYMRDDLEATILQGYNIVGDATIANLLPLLTGKAQTELPEARIDEADTGYVDIYPLLWYAFEKKGYVTMFAEDDPTISTFNLRLNGFENQPTDHYMRTFWNIAWPSRLSSDNAKYCLGDQPKHMYSLNYTRDFFTVYKNVSRFAFLMLSDLTHWNNNPGEYMDKDLVTFLSGMESAGHLDNTLVVLMGDHGARYSAVRWTVQGKLEERLPMMSFILPKSFRQKYAKLTQNLQKNVNKLTTPFDIHETFLDVLDLSRSKKPVQFSDRGISLFKNIPLNRTCKSAGVDMHWCTCLKMEELDPSNEHVQKSVEEVLRYINKETEGDRDVCEELALQSIKSAALVLPNEKVLRYRFSQDDNQLIANFSSTAKLDIAYYQVTLVTSPGEAFFEATVMANFLWSSYTVNADVSRINMYGHQADCVLTKRPRIRKFCYCKNNLS